MKSGSKIFFNSSKDINKKIIESDKIISIKIFYLIFLTVFVLKGRFKKELYKKERLLLFFKNQNNSFNNSCQIVKELLNKRTQPFDYESEFYFFASLIFCQIPFSFVRFADSHDYIMRGKAFKFDKDK